MPGMRVVFIGLCLGVGALAPALAADKTALKVKPGLWEVTSEDAMSGVPPIPTETLAQLPPEQRAQLEAQMKAMASRPPRRDVSKQCLTQKMLDRSFPDLEEMTKGECTRTVASSTPTLQEGRIQCPGQSEDSGAYRFEARNPESVIGTWDMIVTDGVRTMTTKYTTQAKWLGADCGDVKPED